MGIRSSSFGGGGGYLKYLSDIFCNANITSNCNVTWFGFNLFQTNLEKKVMSCTVVYNHVET